MNKLLLRWGTLCLLMMFTVIAKAGDNDLLWDYTETAPGNSPDNGLYFGSKVNDAAGTNNGLKGVKLNASGYAYFEKAAVAGKLTLTIGKRSGTGDYCVDVYNCTITNGVADTENMTLIATTDKVQESNPVTVEIPADVTGIYIKRNTGSEGVLSKIVFKENVKRAFTNFEITNVELSDEFDASTLPAGVTFSGTQRNDSHGYGNVTLVVPVDGTVKFTIGGCQYSNPATFTVTNEAGDVVATLEPKTTKCYHQDGTAITYFYTGEPTTLTFNKIPYLPYFKAEATEVSEVTVTYKDQNGNVLGIKSVFEGEAIGETPYTEADLTIAEGEAFRGWTYSNGIKVKATDIVSANVTVSAKVTSIETVTVGSVQNYDLTLASFYPEDHETFSVVNGTYYNNHGFTFSGGGSFSVDVAGNAQIVLTLCQFSKDDVITVTDKAGNVIANDVPAKSENDGGLTTVNYSGEATTLTFTFAQQAYLHKVAVYNVQNFMEKNAESGYYIVPAGDAASLILAINNASAEAGSKIFLPNGTYDLGETVLTTVSGTNVSLIGESMENTIIVTTPPISKEGLGSADLLVNTGTGLYLQDLTLKNALDYYTAGTGRAATLHDKGTQTINKNVRHLSYQDTYYSHKVGGLFYFEGGEIHGTVDYMCGNGKVYFNEVKLVNEERSSGATMTANSELYVFNNCEVENHAANYNLGRAWSDDPVCIYLNTTLQDPSKLIANRWNLTGINCNYSIAGEYGTKDSAGNDITPSENNVTFTNTKTPDKTQLNTILDASALDTYSIENVLGEWATTAVTLSAQVEAPEAELEDDVITWTAVENATAYAIFVDGKFLGITTGTSFTTTEPTADEDSPSEAKRSEAAADPVFTIRAANARGGFGEAKVVTVANAIKSINGNNEKMVSSEIYSLNGMHLAAPQKGVNIIKMQMSDGSKKTAKVIVK